MNSHTSSLSSLDTLTCFLFKDIDSLVELLRNQFLSSFFRLYHFFFFIPYFPFLLSFSATFFISIVLYFFCFFFFFFSSFFYSFSFCLFPPFAFTILAFLTSASTIFHTSLNTSSFLPFLSSNQFQN